MEENKWLEDLIWCPSQIFYNFVDPRTNTPYQLYLRWRHSDPWTADLYTCTDRTFMNWDKRDKRLELDKIFSDDEYKDLEKYCFDKLKEIFPYIEFKSPV